MLPQTIVTRNVNSALEDGLWLLKISGVHTNSRNGVVIRAPGPVITHYKRPEERVLWSSLRNANPFFHLMESMWMLAGRNDVAWVEKFAKQMREYAEPAGHIHGAYGHRWMTAFGFNQLTQIVNHLNEFPDSRRAVLQMWSANLDLNQNMAKDIPCNTHAYFERRNESLDMTVCCRSNDIIWGAYGANAVHFSILQQFLAEALGLKQGVYNQFSNNYHLYTGFGPGKKLMEEIGAYSRGDKYETNAWLTPRIVHGAAAGTIFGIQTFCASDWEVDAADYTDNPFIITVLDPMRKFYMLRKEGVLDSSILMTMIECDWKYAALDWAERNLKDA